MRSTLDINCLSLQERTEHMEKGLCFVCHKPGHHSSDHKCGNPPPLNSMYHFTLEGKGAKAYANIRAIMADLDKEEKGKNPQTHGGGGVFKEVACNNARYC